MNWFSKKKEPVLDRAEALACRPLKNPAAVETRLAGGIVRLSYSLPVKPFMAALARRLGASEQGLTKKLELDQLGSAVWDRIDGRATVGDLVDWFGREYQVLPQEAEAAVTAFLRELGRRGLAALG
ncbi:MAG: PqqD family protein [Pseudomonadota bacterium]